jgi:hypothetical protein
MLPVELLVNQAGLPGGLMGAIPEQRRGYWDDAFLGSETLPDKYPAGTMHAVFTRGERLVNLAFPATALCGGAEFFRTLEEMARSMYAQRR